MEVLLLCLLSLLANSNQINFVTNGGFDSPVVDTWAPDLAEGWTGTNFNLMNVFTNVIGHGQYIDLQQNIDETGTIEQVVVLPLQNEYILSFSYLWADSTWGTHLLNIYWNGQLKLSITAQNSAPKRVQQKIMGKQGKNMLKFEQSGTSAVQNGFWLDEIEIHLKNITQYKQKQSRKYLIQEEKIKIISSISSTPISQIKILKALYMFLDDLWLYSYNENKYEENGILLEIFNTANAVQLMKMELSESVSNFLHLSELSNYLQLSDYTAYTQKQFLTNQNSPSILIQSNFSFFTQFVPQNILIYTFMYMLYKLSKHSKLNKRIQIFSYVKILICKCLFQTNIGYFSFVCCSHLAHPFTFCFGDKLALLFTVGYFLVIVIYAICSSFFISRFLKKCKAYFFITPLEPKFASIIYYSIRNPIRSVLRGFIFFYFHYNYQTQLIVLIFLEIVILLYTIYTENKNSIFLHQTNYIFTLFYHLIFIVFNFVLLAYFQLKQYEQKEQDGRVYEDSSYYNGYNGTSYGSYNGSYSSNNGTYQGNEGGYQSDAMYNGLQALFQEIKNMVIYIILFTICMLSITQAMPGKKKKRNRQRQQIQLKNQNVFSRFYKNLMYGQNKKSSQNSHKNMDEKFNDASKTNANNEKEIINNFNGNKPNKCYQNIFVQSYKSYVSKN